MNLKPERRDDVELNLTPLIDVVFLLLIFFMVSTTFEQQAKLKVQLPQASVAAQKQEEKTIVIGIDANGRYFVNDRQLVNTTRETLTAALKQVTEDRKDIPLILKADGQTPHQAVVTAMDVASKLGLSRLSIATVEQQAD